MGGCQGSLPGSDASCRPGISSPLPPCSPARLPAAMPRCLVQLEVLERLGNVLMGQQMLPVKLGNAIADHAGRVLHAG